MSQDTNSLNQKPQPAYYATGLLLFSLVCCWGRFCGDTTPEREEPKAQAARRLDEQPAATVLPLADKPYGDALQTLQRDYDGKKILGGSRSKDTFNDAMHACQRAPEDERGECFGYIATILSGYADNFLNGGAHDKLDVMAGLVTAEVMAAHPQLAGLSTRFEASRQQRVDQILQGVQALIEGDDTAALREATQRLRRLAPKHEQLDGMVRALDQKLKPTLTAKGSKIGASEWELTVTGAKTLREFKNPKQGVFTVMGQKLYLDKKIVAPEEGEYFVIVELKAKNTSNELRGVSPNGGALSGVNFSLESTDGVVFSENSEIGDYVTKTPSILSLEVPTGRTEPFKLFFEAAGVEREQIYLLIKSDVGVARVKLF